jgi:hypothetical protein
MRRNKNICYQFVVVGDEIRSVTMLEGKVVGDGHPFLMVGNIGGGDNWQIQLTGYVGRVRAVSAGAPDPVPRTFHMTLCCCRTWIKILQNQFFR